jgi:hypothetical protein
LHLLLVPQLLLKLVLQRLLPLQFFVHLILSAATACAAAIVTAAAAAAATAAIVTAAAAAAATAAIATTIVAANATAIAAAATVTASAAVSAAAFVFQHVDLFLQLGVLARKQRRHDVSLILCMRLCRRFRCAISTALIVFTVYIQTRLR